MILAVVNRSGLWAGAEHTPFGHGRPFTRSQLELAVVEAELSPTAWSRALYAPPWPILAPYAELIEQTVALLAPPVSGLILMEAVKQTFAVKPRQAGRRVGVAPLRPAVAAPVVRLEPEQ